MFSKKVPLSAVTRSETATRRGIKNTPDQRQLRVIANMCINFIDPLFAAYKDDIYITSMYRSPELNRAVNGSDNSHHTVSGVISAVDLDTYNNMDLFYFIRDTMNFYYLILEYPDKKTKIPQWIHISYSLNDQDNKLKKVLIATKNRKGNTVYLPYIGNEHLVK